MIYMPDDHYNLRSAFQITGPTSPDRYGERYDDRSVAFTLRRRYPPCMRRQGLFIALKCCALPFATAPARLIWGMWVQSAILVREVAPGLIFREFDRADPGLAYLDWDLESAVMMEDSGGRAGRCYVVTAPTEADETSRAYLPITPFS